MDHDRAQVHLVGVVRIGQRALVAAQELIGRGIAVAVREDLVVRVDSRPAVRIHGLVIHGRIGAIGGVIALGHNFIGLAHPRGAPLRGAVEHLLVPAKAHVVMIRAAVVGRVLVDDLLRGAAKAVHRVGHHVELDAIRLGERDQRIGKGVHRGAILAGGHAVGKVQVLHVVHDRKVIDVFTRLNDLVFENGDRGQLLPGAGRGSVGLAQELAAVGVGK